MFASDAADFEGELGGSGERIAASVHGRGARVRFLPMESDRVALDTFRTEHGRQGKIHALKYRSLLDVELDVDRGVFLFASGFRETIDLNAAPTQCVFEARAFAIGAHAIGSNAGSAGKGR